MGRVQPSWRDTLPIGSHGSRNLGATADRSWRDSEAKLEAVVVVAFETALEAAMGDVVEAFEHVDLTVEVSEAVDLRAVVVLPGG